MSQMSPSASTPAIRTTTTPPARRTTARPARTPSSESARNLQVRAALRALTSALSANELAIFESRVIGLDSRSVKQLAIDLGIASRQVQRLELASGRIVRKRLRSGPFAELRSLLLRLCHGLGSVAPLEHAATRTLFLEVFDGHLAPNDLALVLWLAGPYETREGRLVRSDVELRPLEREAARLLAEYGAASPGLPRLFARHGVAAVYHASLIDSLERRGGRPSESRAA